MKILFLTSGSVRSNFTFRALSLARELQRRGHQVTLICPSADKYNAFRKEKITELEGVRILQPWQFATSRLEINLLPYILGASYLVLREKPDLVYIYKPTPISLVGFLSKCTRRTPVVLDMDDLGSEVMKIEGHPGYQRKLVEWCEILGAKGADRMVVASRYLFDKYRNQFPDKPLHLLPNGVGSDWLTPVVPTTHPLRIVFMGSLNRRNILEPLFDVLPAIIEKHPATELLLMGDGAHLEYFKNKSRELGIGEHIEFTGWLPLPEARLRLKAGDLGYGFMPDEVTTRAASNMKISQYMARGVVPLVSQTGDLPRMVDQGRAGYITRSESAADIQAEILRALEDPARRTHRAIAARDFAAKYFDWEKLAEGFDDWLHRRPQGANRDRRKIYVVTTNLPANVGGPEIRNLNLLRQIVRRGGMQARLFCLGEDDRANHAEAISSELGIPAHRLRPVSLSRTAQIYAFLIRRIQPFLEGYRRSGLGDKFREVCESDLPDLVLIEQLDAYYCLRPHLNYLRQRGVRIILDAHNVEIDAFEGARRSFPLLKRWAGKFLSGRLRRMEIEAARKADAVFACSVADAEYFQRYNRRVEVVPNGVACDEFRPHEKSGADAEELIFIGGTQYGPNADALRFYLRAVHPKVKRHCPRARLLAIGATAAWLQDNQLQNEDGDESVVPLGFVEDVKPYLDRAWVGICPIRQGSGTRLKVLTFMAAGLPVVSTRKGAEGINCTDRQDILLADDAEQFATAVVALLKQPLRRQTFGSRGRAFVLKNYDWNVIGEGLVTILQNI